MNFRRTLMASGSLHLWKKVAAPLSSGVQNHRIWKAACTTIAGPSSAVVETCEDAPIEADLCDGVSEKVKVGSRQMGKRKVFQKLRSLTVETVDLIIREEQKKGVSITQKDLTRWAKLLAKKHGKPENALGIFRWMDKKKMQFTESEVAFYLDLIAKVEGVDAADDFFGTLEPVFNSMDPHAKNWPAYKVLKEYLDERYKHNRINGVGLKRFVLYVNGKNDPGTEYSVVSGQSYRD